jgi:Fibronectin type III domain
MRIACALTVLNRCPERRAELRTFSLLVAVFWLATSVALADQSVTLGWIASTSRQTTGYAVYYGTSSGSYDYRIDSGTNTSATATNLQAGPTYYFVVVSVDADGVESMPSNEVHYPTLGTPPAFTSISLVRGRLVMTWNAVPGQAYQVQFKTSLEQRDWIPLGRVVRTAHTSAALSDNPIANSQRYYRIAIISEPQAPWSVEVRE